MNPYPTNFTFALEFEFRFPFHFEALQGSTLQEQHDYALHIIQKNIYIPNGWQLQVPCNNLKGHNAVCEIIANPPNGAYYTNTKGNWFSLKEELKKVQDTLPNGFESVHMHIGCIDYISKANLLLIDEKKFGRAIKGFEAMWRVLSGYGYRAPKFINNMRTTFGINFIPTFSNTPLGIYNHNCIFNLSIKYPTIEIKTITGLIGKHSVKQHLSVETIQDDLRWVFVLLNFLLFSKDNLSLVTLGLPTPAGDKPSVKQIDHFLSRFFADDLIGKSFAKQRFIEIEHEERGARDLQLAALCLEVAATYYYLGLGVVYELHEKYDGLDEKIEERILKSPRFFKRLCNDLRTSRIEPALYDYFSCPKLIEALKEHLNWSYWLSSLNAR